MSGPSVSSSVFSEPNQGTSVLSEFSEPNPQEGRPLVHYAYVDKNDTCENASDVKSSDKNGDNTIIGDKVMVDNTIIGGDKVMVVGRKLPDFRCLYDTTIFLLSVRLYICLYVFQI